MKNLQIDGKNLSQTNLIRDKKLYKFSKLTNFSELNSSYSVIDSSYLEPWNAYWLYAEEDGELVIKASVPSGPDKVTLSSPSEISTSTVTLSWSQYTAQDFAEYRIYYRSINASNFSYIDTIKSATTTTMVSPGLSDFTTYYFKVEVCDTNSDCTMSDEVSATTLNAVPTAVTLSEAFDVGTSTLKLSWTQNTDTDFASYKLYWSDTSGIIESSLLVTTYTQQTHTSTPLVVSPNTKYYFKIYVCDTGNLCSGSNEISVTTANTQPTPVTLFEATNVSTSTLTLS